MPGSLFNLKIVVLAKSAHHVRAERTAWRDVRAAFAQLQRARGGIRHNRQADAFHLGTLAPVIVIPLQNNFSVRILRDERERPRSNGMAVERLAAAVRHNSKSSFRNVVKQRTVRLRKMDDNGGVVRRVNSFHQFVSCGLQRRQGAIANAVQRPLYVARGQRPAVMELNPTA